MTKKTYQNYRLLLIAFVSVGVSVSISLRNWYLAVAMVIAAWGLLYILRRRVADVLADERDYQLAGRAATYAISIYSGVCALVGMVLYVSYPDNSYLFSLANFIFYSACFLMILYSILFRIYAWKK